MGRLAAGPLRDDVDAGRRGEISGRALEIARRLGDPATLAFAIDARFGAVMSPFNIDELFALADEMQEVAGRAGDPERVVMAHQYRRMLFTFLGDMEAAREAILEIGRLTERLRQPPWRWFLLCEEASLAILEGRFDEAERLAGEAFEIGSRSEEYALFAYRLQRFWVYKERGRSAEIMGEFGESVTAFDLYPQWRALLPALCLDFGLESEARRAFERVARDGIERRPANEEWLLTTGALADAAVTLGAREAAARLYDQLIPHADKTVSGVPNVVLGSMSRPLGRLAALLSRPSDAERHFEEALRANRRMGARPWGAHTEHDYAAMLLERDAPGDRERAVGLLSRSLEASRSMGMRLLEGRVLARLARLGISTAGLPAPTAPAAPEPSVFRREGEYWSIAFEGKTFRLRDSKGLRYIAFLLSRPGRELHVLDLVSAVDGGPGGRRSTAEVAGLTASAPDDEDLMDDRARAEYRRRLEDLREEVEEAESWGDPERASRARQEMDAIAAELAHRLGLGGRSRKAVGPGERARQSVAKAIKVARERVAEQSPQLGRHLDATLHTGTFCSYSPDPRVPPRWVL